MYKCADCEVPKPFKDFPVTEGGRRKVICRKCVAAKQARKTREYRAADKHVDYDPFRRHIGEVK